MTLMHYANQPVTFDPDRRYTQNEPHGHGKPVGFWISVAGEDDWPSWCHSEESFRDSLVTAHSVTLTDDANIIRVSNPEELDKFHDRFAVMTDFDRRYHYNDSKWWPIEWAAVAGEYDGVIIAPYLWERRLTRPSWYYTWDCASGCIWSASVIESVEMVNEGATA